MQPMCSPVKYLVKMEHLEVSFVVQTACKSYLCSRERGLACAWLPGMKGHTPKGRWLSNFC